MEFNTTDFLGHDVFVEIFNFLPERDVRNCELVCKKWKRFTQSLTPWRKVFWNKMKASPVWKESWKATELDEKELKLVQYKDICTRMSIYLQNMDRNWHKGKHKVIQCKVNDCPGVIDVVDGYIACTYFNPFTIDILNRKPPMAVKKTVKVERPHQKALLIDTNTLISSHQKTIQFLDVRTDQVIHELNLSYKPVTCCYGSTLLGANSFVEEGDRHLTIWKMENISDIALVKEWTFQTSIYLQSIDEHFIVFEEVPSYFGGCHTWKRTIHFMSTKTFEIERSFSQRHRQYKYEKGLLFFIAGRGVIRIIDVASGTYLHTLRHKRLTNSVVRKAPVICIKANTKYLVIGDNTGYMSNRQSISVYDLEKIKNPSANPKSLLVYKFHAAFHIDDLSVTETQIVYLGYEEMTYSSFIVVMDFITRLKFPDSIQNKPPSAQK